MSINFKVPIGNKITVDTWNRDPVTVESNGKVDPQEANLRKESIADILDSRVENFTRSHDIQDLGKGWKDLGVDVETGEVIASINGNAGGTRPISSTDEETVASIAGQFLIIDPKVHTVTVQTQDVKGPFFNHWIQGEFDAQSGKINPQTINEWVSH